MFIDDKKVCCGCNCEVTGSFNQIFDENADATGEYICESCFKKDDEYGHCKNCHDGEIYYSEDLENGCCPYHKKESRMSSEDKAGWGHNIEKAAENS